MRYNQEDVLKAFSIFMELAQKGVAGADFAKTYKVEEAVRALTDHFVSMNDADCILVGQELYLIPKTKLSPFHISNEQLKKLHLPSRATNVDLYLLYFCTIVLIGCFYNSYTTKEPTLDFITIDRWLQEVNKRMNSLKEHDQATLREKEKEFAYRWTALLEKWEALDDVRETATRQTGNTLSRISFLDTVRRFLEHYDIIEHIGNGELTITEKTKVIVGRYFMEQEFNRGIMEFLYSFEEEEEELANHQ